MNPFKWHPAAKLLLILLLLEMPKRLKACVREMNTVARLGGGKFVVLIGELHAAALP